eukprot:scaffold238416_cov36-Tisochrysis_lutea.AAC.4
MFLCDECCSRATLARHVHATHSHAQDAIRRTALAHSVAAMSLLLHTPVRTIKTNGGHSYPFARPKAFNSPHPC